MRYEHNILVEEADGNGTFKFGLNNDQKEQLGKKGLVKIAAQLARYLETLLRQ